jgi:hypothetical protein
MPSRRKHEKLSKLLTGYSCEKTHMLLDYPAIFLGKNHRVLFHDLASASIIGFLSDGLNGMISAISHIILDEAYSKNKILKKLINYLF